MNQPSELYDFLPAKCRHHAEQHAELLTCILDRFLIAQESCNVIDLVLDTVEQVRDSNGGDLRAIRHLSIRKRVFKDFVSIYHLAFLCRDLHTAGEEKPDSFVTAEHALLVALVSL